jgi:transposase
MIRAGFLLAGDRLDMIALARDGAAAHRLARRAWFCWMTAGAARRRPRRFMSMMTPNLHVGRAWLGLYAEDGLGRFEAGGSLSRMSGADQDRLKAWVTAALPGSTRQIGAFIAAECGFSHESRSGLIALLHRLGLEYHKPEVIPRRLDEAAQLAFVGFYKKLLNGLGQDEAVLFADAVHPTHAARPAGCWAPAGDRLAIDPRIKSEETSGRQRPRRGQSGNRPDEDD